MIRKILISIAVLGFLAIAGIIGIAVVFKEVIFFDDVVVSEIKTADELQDNHLSWFYPVERADLKGGKNFRLENDLDLNDSLITFNFDSLENATNFVEALRKKGFLYKEAPCTMYINSCKFIEASKEDSIVVLFEPQPSKDVYWVSLKNLNVAKTSPPERYGYEVAQ